MENLQFPSKLGETMEIDGWHGFMVKIITEREGRCGIDHTDYMRYVAKMVFRRRL